MNFRMPLCRAVRQSETMFVYCPAMSLHTLELNLERRT
jgi:hypothetical protein